MGARVGRLGPSKESKSLCRGTRSTSSRRADRWPTSVITDGRTIKSDVLDGISTWVGEAFVGSFPLLAHLFSEQFFEPEAGAKQSFQAEICILAVVTAGLSMLAGLPFGPKGWNARATRLTYFLYLLTLVSLLAGAMLYSFIVAKTSQSTDLFAYATLATALFGSFSLTVEREILGGFDIPEGVRLRPQR